MIDKMASTRRFDVLGSPREWTVLGVGDARTHDRYKRLAQVARVNVPRRLRGRERERVFARAYRELVGRTTFHDLPEGDHGTY